jgi:polar amino acid transport system substrate-binding protein
MKHRKSLLLLILMSASLRAWSIDLVTEDDPPLNMKQDGRIVGESTEKLEEAFKRINAASHMEVLPWSRAYQLAQNNADTCVFSTARTPERESQFQWVGPIAELDWTLYARKDNAAKIGKIDDVRKETIGGYTQDVISVWLSAHGYHVDTAPSDDGNPQRLLHNQFNYWASSHSRATALLAKQGLTDSIVPVLSFGHTDLYLACNPGVSKDIVHKLNDTLKQMTADGTMAAIDKRYPH